MIEVNISQAIRLISTYLEAKLVPMVHGSPGIGKSDIVKQIAANYNLKVIDLRLSQCDPTDLMGFPTIRGDKSGYIPMDTFPIEGDPIPDGYSGWLVFLDEFNSGAPAVQAAAYKLILDKMVGQYHLHKKVAIVCAGNLETDNAIVNPMSTAMQSRLVHLKLVVDYEEWLNWANSNGVDYRLTGYINFKPGNIYTFQPDHSDMTYSCPRTLAFASKLLTGLDADSVDALPLLAGTLSEGIAREVISFCRIEQRLPKIGQIEANPDNTPVPEEPSILWALTGSISHHATVGNFPSLLKYVKRMPREFQVVCLRASVRRNKDLIATKELQTWIATTATDLF
jgi:hypothetical protein